MERLSKSETIVGQSDVLSQWSGLSMLQLLLPLKILLSRLPFSPLSPFLASFILTSN